MPTVLRYTLLSFLVSCFAGVALLRSTAANSPASFSPPVLLAGCDCNAYSPNGGNLASCQKVNGAFGCVPGVCGTYDFCTITGNVTTSSTCSTDQQVCVTATVITCLSGTNHTIGTGGGVPVACGSFNQITIHFCSTAYPLGCISTGYWTQQINCTACLGD